MATPNIIFSIHYAPNVYNMKLTNKDRGKYWKERQFYSCKNSYNFVGYMNDGSKTQIDFVDYSGNNEKSAGLFDEDGLCSPERIKEIKANMRKTESPIWHGFISFEKEFGENYCSTFEKALDLMQKEFPRFLRKTNLNPNNIEWCAGFHVNTNNKHIHFSFYEKEPQRYRNNKRGKFFSDGDIEQVAIDSIKERAESCLTQTSTKLAGVRTDLTQTFKESIQKNLSKRRNMKKIMEILILIPKDGRVSYDSENMLFLKNKINYLVDLMIEKDEKSNAVFKTYLSLLAEKDASVRRMCVANKIDPTKVILYKKYLDDLYRRLGNVAIKGMLKINQEMKALEFETNKRLVRKRIERRKMDYMLEQSLYLSEQVQKEAMAYFQEHMKTLEEMRIKVLIEQGIIQL